jgi:hypothetical protein
VKMPFLHDAADGRSLQGQRRYMRGTSARLWLAVIAAVLAAYAAEYLVRGHIEILGLAAALAFLLALLVEIWQLVDRPERSWYEGRALAESTKTLAWRFAVGGHPFPASMAQPSEAFREQLAALLPETPHADVGPAPDLSVSPEMAQLRESSLATRRETYVAERVEDQRSWYARKARHNERRAYLWKFLLIGLEVLGVVVALLKAFGHVHVDLTAIVSAMVGSGVAWLAVKQHEAVTRAYSVASAELGAVAARLGSVEDEEQWAAAVADAEEAISREHSLWRAARIVHQPSAHGVPDA